MLTQKVSVTVNRQLQNSMVYLNMPKVVSYLAAVAKIWRGGDCGM